jgi:hypothetical protein
MDEVMNQPSIEGGVNQAGGNEAENAGQGQPGNGTNAGVQHRPNEGRAGQEFYWRRQAERAQKELEAIRKTSEAEANMLRAEREEAQARVKTAEEKAARLATIAAAGLPAELAALVPEAEAEKVQEFVEKLKPIAERLRTGGPGGTLTNPARSASGDSARLNQLAAGAGRGDKGALREYAHLREKMRNNK